MALLSLSCTITWTIFGPFNCNNTIYKSRHLRHSLRQPGRKPSPEPRQPASCQTRRRADSHLQYRFRERDTPAVTISPMRPGLHPNLQPPYDVSRQPAQDKQGKLTVPRDQLLRMACFYEPPARVTESLPVLWLLLQVTVADSLALASPE